MSAVARTRRIDYDRVIRVGRHDPMRAPTADNPHPTWASGRKDIVGCGLGSSRLWFTLAEGIITEVYYPRIDIPQIKDLGFIVADGAGFWVELRRLGAYTVNLAEPGAPAVEITHSHQRFTFTLQVCPSPSRDVLSLRFRLEGDTALRPYALLAPRLGAADDNEAFVNRHNGRTVLWAEQGPFGLALLAQTRDGADAWTRASAGCAEASDGWWDFAQHGRMTWAFDAAGPAPVALMGELPREARLALGLATSKEAAATLAASELLEDFDEVWDEHVRAWRDWHARRPQPPIRADVDAALRLSATVLQVHQDRTYRGAAVASLSAPWGESSRSRGGYHLVWPRDLVECAGALVAMGAFHEARDVLRYLMATQQADGHWRQNQWLGGTAYWPGLQLDETAFPVLLAAALCERGELGGIPVQDFVRRALGFIAANGPTTCQDRWEEDAGVNTFTLAVVIAALVEGAELLDGEARAFALKTADAWNARLEDWAFVRDTPLARRLGASGYYIRIAPPDIVTREAAKMEPLRINNLAADPGLPADAQIATDFLQLVRYGLRRADDACIASTIAVVDALLKVDSPSGPVWRRYTEDGYGEHDDGAPFDGVGRGRAWPLLTGERGHYALCAGEDVMPYLEAMMAMANPAGLIPEQVWDAPPIPARGLAPGEPTGAAMPLVWAHAEFVKLCHSRSLGYPVDRPAATWRRYQGVRPKIGDDVWTPAYRPRRLRAGASLCVAVAAPALVHWGANGWKDAKDVATRDSGLGLQVADLSTAGLSAGDTVQFTIRWVETGAWEGADHELTLV